MSQADYPFSFRELSSQEFDEIQPLWETLRAHHTSMSSRFGGEIRRRAFGDRKAELIAKAGTGLLRAEVAYTGAGKRIVAYCIGTVSAEGIGEIDSLFVEERERGQGLGTALMRRALTWLDQSKATRTIVSVLVDNAEALEFYRRIGFQSRTILMQQIRDPSPSPTPTPSP